MSVFLRGHGVTLHPSDAPAPHGADAWLDPGPRGPAHDEIVLALRDAEGAEAGTCGLTAIDWLARSARLCAGGPRLSGQALGASALLLARYAFDELNLDLVEAVPTRETAVGPLRAAGFGPSDAGEAYVIRRASTPRYR